MTDLEELFRPLIADSARAREPVEAIETRARERGVRRRRRQAQYRFGAAFVVVALVATTVGIVASHRSTSTHPAIATTVPAPTTTTVPEANVPAGWTTHDYGLARLSIPPGWTVTTGCPVAHALLMVDPTVPGPDCIAVLYPGITIEPLATTSTYLPTTKVNGIPYEELAPSCLTAVNCRSAIVNVPALHVTISFDGVAAAPILRTLTYSTYARVQQHPFGPAPASWKTVTYGGYSVRVPRPWQVFDTGLVCGPGPDAVYRGAAGTAACPLVRPLPSTPPAAWLWLAPSGASQPAVPGPSRLGVLRHHGLAFGPDQVVGPLASQQSFTVVGGPKPIQLTLGFGLDASVARGILGSLIPVAR